MGVRHPGGGIKDEKVVFESGWCHYSLRNGDDWGREEYICKAERTDS